MRDENVISLAEGIRRLTSLPIQQLGLTGRGRLAANYLADVVVFDPAKITDHATFASRTPEIIFRIGKLSLANVESGASHFPYWQETE